MALPALTKKAKSASSSWWKWLIGALLAIGIAYVVWKMVRMRDSIARLKAEKLALKEMIDDLEMQAKNTQDIGEAMDLLIQAKAVRKGLGKVDEDLEEMKLEYACAAKAVDEARTWRELEALAKGGE